jgi:hypothetical protein
MGGGTWDDDAYRITAKRASGRAAFTHTDDVDRGLSNACHDSMNPYGQTRESRDSDEHPESLAIGVAFDVTGSMARVPTIFQQKLKELMNLLLRKGYVEHPQILNAAIGDATCDEAPLQVGQFESDIKIHEDLTRIFLEGGGGGHITESYELLLYFFARHTIIDCWEKRRKKGYLFITGDETPYPSINKDEVFRIMGDNIQADIPVEEIITEVRQRYHLFFTLPAQTAHYRDPRIIDRWTELLGPEHVLTLQEPAEISELIAGTIGITEGIAIDQVADDVAAVSSAVVARHITTALAPYAAKQGELVKVDLPPGKRTRGVKRL